LAFLALFFLLPLAELMILIEVGGEIGGWETIGVCLLTAMVGGSLARRQGMGVLRRMRVSMHQGQLPAEEMIDSLFIVVAGLLLMTPGFVTDSIGLVLLTPPIRALARPAVISRFARRPGQPFARGYGSYDQYAANQHPEDEEYGSTYSEPEFLPPGSVQRPPRKDDPPEIIVD
tara:strand:+ start:69 stop:590 length:522 start_codon:yes stop_codon:yes gene_type:complete